jgi:hypothetical protein
MESLKQRRMLMLVALLVALFMAIGALFFSMLLRQGAGAPLGFAVAAPRAD